MKTTQTALATPRSSALIPSPSARQPLAPRKPMPRHLVRSPLVLAIALSLSSFSVQAEDLTAGAATEQIEGSAENADKNANNERFEADRLVVYGEKIARPLEETTSSVALYREEDFQEFGDFDFTDVLSRTAGVYITADNETLGIRGVPLQGLGAGSSDAFSVYVDGAISPRNAILFSPFQLWDVEQLEIFRGAQSTVQGRNSLIGAINLRTKNPTYDPQASLRVNYGTYDEVGASAAISGGLVDGKLAARIAVDYQENDGYIRNQTLDEDANPVSYFTGRAKLLFEPTDDLDLLLTYSRIDSSLGNQAVDQVNADPFDYDVFTNTNTDRDIEQDTGIAELSYQINDRWTFTSVTSYAETETDNVLDFDQRASARVDTLSVLQDDDVFTEEVRFSYDDGTLRGHLSGYYFDGENDRVGNLRATVADFLDPSVLAVYSDGFVFDQTQFSSQDITNTAVFGEINYLFTPEWELVVGLRYDHEDNDTVSSNALSAVTAFNGLVPQLDGLIQSMLGQTQPLELDADYDAWLPKLGFNYRFADDQLLAFTVQRGYRAGGASFNLVEGTTVAFDPEYTINYELAYRASLLDHRLSLGANLYRIDWNDQQVTVFTDPTNRSSAQVENAGESRLHGVELSATYAIDDNWTLYANGSFNDTEYLDFVSSTQNLSGRNFEGAPKHQYNLGLSYRLGGAFTANLNAIYQSERTTVYLTETDATSPNFGNVIGSRRSDDYIILNANVQYQAGDFTLAAYVRNLFDKEYITNNQLGAVLDVGAPITAGVSLRYDYR